jgi:hypothetical protein
MMERRDGQRSLVGEYIAIYKELGLVIGPVATTRNPNRAEVLAARNKQFADLLRNGPEHVFVLTMSNSWNEQRALDAFNLSSDGDINRKTKAELGAMSDGRDVRIAVPKPGLLVSMNGTSFYQSFLSLLQSTPSVHGNVKIERHVSADIRLGRGAT